MPNALDEVLSQGLMRFYSSQAEVMLAQYRNINDLLGPTTHHSHPGTHCEVLLRNCLRRFLPPSWSADKGFIFGRVSRGEESTHGPEIDILIHDESHRRPLFRLDDFVIVHPESVVAMIAVKKNFDGSQLSRGVANAIAAKQHVFDMSRDSGTGKFHLERFLFSAVIGFEGGLAESSLRDCLEKLQLQYQAFEREIDRPWNTSILVLPDLVGTLSGQIALGNDGANRRGYDLCASVQGSLNIVVPMLIWKMSRMAHLRTHPIAFPPGIESLGGFTVGPEQPPE